MGLITRQIPALYDGVSQQPPNLRLPSQSEVMVNGWCNVVQGLMKRPPTQHVARLSENDLSSFFIYTINVSPTQRFQMVLGEGSILVFDMDGNPCTVDFTHGQGYLYPGGANPITWHTFLSGAADFMNDVGHWVKPTSPNGFIYKVVVNNGGNGGAAEPTWPTTPGDTVLNGDLVFQCYVPFQGTFNPKAHFAATMINGTTFIINKTCATAMQFAGDDRVTAGNAPNSFYTSIGAITGDSFSFQQGVPTAAYGPNPTPTAPGGLSWFVSQSFQNLPVVDTTVDWPDSVDPSNPDGTIYRITGDDSNSFAAYFVIYKGGAWNETVSPSNNSGTDGLPCVIDPLSMPWALSATDQVDFRGNPIFLFQPIMWEPRRAGDGVTNPPPSFIGNTLNDVFTYQNRLGFCSSGSIILSQAGQFNNFFRLTVTQNLDDQVIDLSSSDNELTTFFFGVPFATGMMLFSDQAQIRLVQPYDGNLTYATAALQVSTRFVCSTTVRPVFMGTDVYFVSEDDSFARLREYYVMSNYMGQFQMDAADVTAHVPKFIPKGATFLTGSLIHNALFTATSAIPQRLYVYSFYWQDQQKKAQSAWHYWDFGAGTSVISAAALDDYLWIVIRRADGFTYLERMSLAIGANVGIVDQNGAAFDLLIDRRSQITGVFEGGGEGVTDFTFPYGVTLANTQVVTAAGETMSLAGATVSGNVLTVPGNKSGDVWVGEKYTFTYQFSQQFMTNQNNVAILSGRLQLRNWRIYFDTAAVFNVTVAPYGLVAGANTVTYVPADAVAFTGWTIGEAAFNLGVPTFQSGMFEIGVWGESREAVVQLSNDTPYPSIFLEAEWEGDYTNRARNV